MSHYIQPSNFSSALLFVCVGPTQCCLNVTILQRISSFWNTITNKLEGGRLLRELGSWKLKSTFHKMQIIIIGSKKCQTNKTIFFFIQVCLGSVFCSLHKELIFFFLFEEFKIWQWCSPKCWILACPVRICTQTLPSLRAIGCWNLNVLCIIFNRKVFTKKSTTKDWGGSLFSLKRLLNSRLAGCSSNFSRICIRKVLKRVHSDPELKICNPQKFFRGSTEFDKKNSQWTQYPTYHENCISKTKIDFEK